MSGLLSKGAQDLTFNPSNPRFRGLGGNSSPPAPIPPLPALDTPPGPRTHMGLVKSPDTFLQLLLSPPHTPHLSNFFLEPRFPSQPALMHLPWTQTEVESGVQGVPSTTCRAPRAGRRGAGAAQPNIPQDCVPPPPGLLPGLTHLGSQHVEVAGAVGSADELALVPWGDARVLGHPGHGQGEPVGAVVVAVEGLALLLPETLTRGWGGRKHMQEAKGRGSRGEGK